MPRCGSQIVLCDVPVRFDTYEGCTHACRYCFVKRKTDIRDIKLGESPEQLIEFIHGKRTNETKWCDWKIPIHWGGMSDPFQPCEKIHKRSLECLRVFAETGYPFMVSTKSILPTQKEYLDLFKRCNCVFQVSMVCSKYDAYEKGAPTFEERKKMLAIMAPNVKRVVVRIQPYLLSVEKDVIAQLKDYAEMGVYGITIEGMKYKTLQKDTEKVYGDYGFKLDILRRSFERIKNEAHRVGLVFLSGENRLRSMGDSRTCCGCEGLEGFRVNTYNLNSMNCGRRPEPTSGMSESGTAFVFKALFQDSGATKAFEKACMKDVMDRYRNDHKDVVR